VANDAVHPSPRGPVLRARQVAQAIEVEPDGEDDHGERRDELSGSGLIGTGRSRDADVANEPRTGRRRRVLATVLLHSDGAITG
jgi:hypothetical protein